MLAAARLRMCTSPIGLTTTRGRVDTVPGKTGVIHDFDERAAVYTFGAPRVGDARWVRSQHGLRHYRFVNQGD